MGRERFVITPHTHTGALVRLPEAATGSAAGHVVVSFTAATCKHHMLPSC